MRWTSGILVLATVSLCSASAGAQEVGEASRSQRKLIQQGLDAHGKGDFADAAEHFRAANAEGELNIVWLNLGRALQKGGECRDAKDAYERALTAPAVPRPPAELVAETARKYRTELDDECPGALRVVCAQDDIELDVDGKALACGETLELGRGTYTVRARWKGQEKEQTASVVAFETAALTFGFAVVGKPEVVPDEPEAAEGGLGVYAWVATGLAVALIGTGTVVAVQRGDTIAEANATQDETEYRSLRDDYDSQSSLMWTTFGLGLAAGTAAGFLFYLDADEPGGVGWRIGPTSVAVEVRF